jgi:hypothetical protein
MLIAYFKLKRAVLENNPRMSGSLISNISQMGVDLMTIGQNKRRHNVTLFKMVRSLEAVFKLGAKRRQLKEIFFNNTVELTFVTNNG